MGRDHAEHAMPGRAMQDCTEHQGLALPQASHVSLSGVFSWVTSHPEGRKRPLNAKKENPQKCSLSFSFFLRTQFFSEDRVTGFGENLKYVTSVPRAARL